VNHAPANRESSAAASIVSLSLRSIMTTDVQPLNERRVRYAGRESREKLDGARLNESSAKLKP
jgi:hypothetical protein